MKPKKMREEIMWVVITHPPEDKYHALFFTRAVARRFAQVCGMARVVRVRVTEAP